MVHAHFSLTKNPFQLNPDPSFLFLSRGHSRARAYLRIGVRQQEGFVLLTGAVGTGKTTLVSDLLQDIDPKRVVAAHLVSTLLNADELLRAVSIAFGLPASNLSKPLLIAQFESFAASLLAQGRRPLLLVDEAQNLAPGAMEELRMLSNAQTGGRALLQSFLIGQSELRDTLRRPDMEQIRQRIIAVHHLGALEEAETREYIEFRLGLAGWKGNPVIDEGAYPALHRATGGIPRRLNLLCGRLLLGACLGRYHRIDAARVDAVAAELTVETAAGAPAPKAARAAAPKPEPAVWRRRPSSANVEPAVWRRRPAAVDGAPKPQPAPDALPGEPTTITLSSMTARLDRIDRRLLDLGRVLRERHAADAAPAGAAPAPVTRLGLPRRLRRTAAAAATAA